MLGKNKHLVSLSLLSLLAASPATAETIFVISDSKTLTSPDSAMPGTLASSKLVTGSQTTEITANIDARPVTGHLYGADSMSRLNTINTATAAELAAFDPFTLALNSGESGFGFRPVAGHIHDDDNDNDDDDHNNDDDHDDNDDGDDDHDDHDGDDDNDRDDDDDDDR